MKFSADSTRVTTTFSITDIVDDFENCRDDSKVRDVVIKVSDCAKYDSSAWSVFGETIFLKKYVPISANYHNSSQSLQKSALDKMQEACSQLLKSASQKTGL